MNDFSYERWISLEEAATYLGIQVPTLRKWLKEGKNIPSHRIGKLWKFKCSELDEWVKSGESGK
jgi:DNA binding domain, excisionase family